MFIKIFEFDINDINIDKIEDTINDYIYDEYLDLLDLKINSIEINNKVKLIYTLKVKRIKDIC